MAIHRNPFTIFFNLFFIFFKSHIVFGQCGTGTSQGSLTITASWQTTGNGIRYITIGAAGNQTFYADFELITYSGSYPVTAQVQIHEGSNLINIRYYTTGPNACGQSVTIGFQLSGSSALPVSCNAKVLDDNANPQAISFCPTK
ncbi:MAG: hypothetical protein HY738_13175 [Bacteroidia bacterium]|nr:hypothetical protein [Bacteroidia bacterium]